MGQILQQQATPAAGEYIESLIIWLFLIVEYE
jgi:hypothetical protein